MKISFDISAGIILLAGVITTVLFQQCSDPKKDSQTHESKEPLIHAINVKTEFFSKDDRQIAYRKIGSGNPIILCNRFRGTLDDWDPLFIDELAKAHQVIYFDYAGIGLSTFKPGVDSLKELKDLADLADHLGLTSFDLIGWSHGGKVAQVFTAKNPDKVKHLILLGTGPIGKTSFPPEQIFFDRALKPVNDFEDEIILFFEPQSEESKKSAKASHDRMAARTADRDVYVTPDRFEKYFSSVGTYNSDEASKAKLFELSIPMLAISGDHDIVFPIENWYAQKRVNPNLQIIMLPQAGHGPQSQYPVLTAAYIRNFITNEF